MALGVSPMVTHGKICVGMSVLVVCYRYWATNAKISHRALGNRLYDRKAGDLAKITVYDVDREVKVIGLKVESSLRMYVVGPCKFLGNVDIG
jgi:hypothetical protein